MPQLPLSKLREIPQIVLMRGDEVIGQRKLGLAHRRRFAVIIINAIACARFFRDESYIVVSGF
jgi:hypothetical protein